MSLLQQELERSFGEGPATGRSRRPPASWATGTVKSTPRGSRSSGAITVRRA